MEQWKLIEDRPKYEVSDQGYVKNVRTGKILKKRLDRDGYPNVYLYKSDGTGSNKKVHRLVAEAFLESDPERDQVNHKNGIKDDNRADNLEWCTGSENIQHAYANGLLTANPKPGYEARTKIREKERLEILHLREINVPVKEIARMYNIGLTTAYSACKRKEVV